MRGTKAVDKALQDLAACVARALREDYRAERMTMCRCSELLQMKSSEYIVTTEQPYKDGSAGDARADMRIVFRGEPAPRIWVEYKPMLKGWNYWNYSKFFNGRANRTHIASSSSIVLNDIDKYELLLSGQDCLAFVLAVEMDSGEEVVIDKTPPLPKTKLRPGQVFHLATERMKQCRGTSPQSLKEVVKVGKSWMQVLTIY